MKFGKRFFGLAIWLTSFNAGAHSSKNLNIRYNSILKMFLNYSIEFGVNPNGNICSKQRNIPNM